MCGEKAQRGGQPAEHRGSPPRVRGEADRLRGISRGKRITPACAGRRLCNASAVRLVEDHPRVCGEKYPAILSRTRTAGSPPRVRGEGSAIAGLVGAARITPACAGRSLHGVKLLLRNEDHPRVCGEKVRSAAGRRLFRGSPPRVRGEAYMCISVETRPRITPACAGRRRPQTGPESYRQDHPRVCGEKRMRSLISPFRAGSPPRVRGEDSIFYGPCKAHGITPACAGRRFWRNGSEVGD